MTFNDLSIGDEFAIVSSNVAQIGIATRRWKLTSTTSLDVSGTVNGNSDTANWIQNLLSASAAIVDRSANPDVVKVNRTAT
jgi:hypothetical protein